MGRVFSAATTLAISASVVGCRFTTPDGHAMYVGEHDSILVADVQLGPGVTEKQIAPLLAGYTNVSVLESKKWKLAGDFDLDAFAGAVEQYATTSGTIDGKPVEPTMTREQFLEEHAEANEKRRAMLNEPRGTRPLNLKILVAELRFPQTLESVTLGTNPRLRCRVDVYDGDQLLGGGDMEAVAGVPGVPLHPASMVSRAAKAMIFDEYTRATILKLVAEMAEETIDALERAR
jgi:hypothetical protein